MLDSWQMAFRKIEIPALNRILSNIMAHPSSADPDTHQLGLDAYARLGGNCITFTAKVVRRILAVPPVVA